MTSYSKTGGLEEHKSWIMQAVPNQWFKNSSIIGGRKSTRAKIRQTAHLVWDIDFYSGRDQFRLKQLASRTGFPF